MKHLTLFILVGVAAFLAWREGLFSSLGLVIKPSAAFGGGASSANIAAGTVAPVTAALGQGSGNLAAIDSRQAYSSVPLAYVPGGTTPTGRAAWLPISDRIQSSGPRMLPPYKLEQLGY